MRHLILAGLVVAGFGQALRGAEPQAPPPLAPVYMLRIEESGVEIDRPLPAGQKPIALSTVPDKPIATTDVDIIPGQPFRVRMKRGREIRILSGRPAAAWNDRGQLSIDITYAILLENPDGPPDRTSARSTSSFKPGEGLILGGMNSSGTSTGPDGTVEHHRRVVIEATLLEKTEDQEFPLKTSAQSQ